MPEAYKKQFKEQQKSFRTRLRNAPIPEYHVFLKKIIVDDYGYTWVTQQVRKLMKRDLYLMSLIREEDI
jgi:hypothetical protein